MAPPTEGKTGTGKGKAGSQRAPRGKSLADRAAAADRLRGVEKPDEKPEEKPAGEGDGKPGEQKPEEKPEEKKPDAKPSGGIEVPAEARTALGQLLAAGKLPELADALGIERKAVDASSAKLALGRKRSQEAAAAERNAREIRDECRRLYRDPHQAKKAVDDGKFHEAAEYVSSILGMDFGEFTRHVANATKGMKPEELERYKRERAVEARERAVAEKEKKTETERTEEERIGKACKTIEAKLSGHDALKLRGGARLIYRVLDENFNSKTGELKIGYKQAADQVLNEFLENARALGLTKGGKQEPEKKPEEKKGEEKPAGKKEFPAPPGERQDGERPRRGRSHEERAALASRQFERSRL